MKGKYLIAPCAAWIDEKLKPNVYAVVTLKQAIRAPNFEQSRWIRGTRSIFEDEVARFYCRLAKEIHGRSAWSRHKHKLIIPNAATIEGGALGVIDGDWHSSGFRSSAIYSVTQKRAHINILLRQPEKISFPAFSQRFTDVWRSMDWAMPDVYIEKRTGNCVSYSLKEGMDSLLVESIKF